MIKNIEGTTKLAKAFKARFPAKDLWIWSGFNFDKDLKDKEVVKYADVIVDGQLVAIELEMTREQSKVIKDMLNIKTEKAPTVREKQLTPRQKEQLSKEQKLEQERIDFRIKQQEQMEENRARAALAREQGLVNLSPEERLRRRQEYFRNKRNEQ